MIPPIIIFGATGVGKSAFIETLYEYQTNSHQHNASLEIIVADSRQIYKDMPISTAQTSRSSRSKLVHHLAATVSCKKPYTVGNFIKQATFCIQEIYARNNIPVIMGGTAYYVYHLYKGSLLSPIVPNTIRSTVATEYHTQGIEALYKKLYDIDPTYAKTISSHDTQRILRTLEVYYHTKRPLSSFENHDTNKNSILQKSLCLKLMRSREQIYSRINNRVNTMYHAGLFDEAYALWRRGLNNTHNAFHTIGVEEILTNPHIITAWQNNPNNLVLQNIDINTIQTIITNIQQHTRNYAKRQCTFFRKLETLIHNSGNIVHYCDIENDQNIQEIHTLIHTHCTKQ